MDTETVVEADLLHEFFAVTASESLYQITDQRWGEKEWPTVERLVSIEGPEGTPKPFRLEDGTSVGITAERGIWLFDRVKGGPFEDIAFPLFWGGHTNKVVALFLDESSASDCLLHRDLQQWDCRWREQTIQVLNEIGDRHPCFNVSPNIRWDCD